MAHHTVTDLNGWLVSVGCPFGHSDTHDGQANPVNREGSVLELEGIIVGTLIGQSP